MSFIAPVRSLALARLFIVEAVELNAVARPFFVGDGFGGLGAAQSHFLDLGSFETHEHRAQLSSELGVAQVKFEQVLSEHLSRMSKASGIFSTNKSNFLCLSRI